MYVGLLLVGVKQDYILVGNGASELIKALMLNVTGVLGNVIHTFEDYFNCCDDCNLVQYIPQTVGFKYTAEDLIEYFSDKKINSLLLVNPDNVSGNYIPFKDIKRLINWTKEKGICFIVDESFVDFAPVDGQCSLLDNAILEANQHLVVVKSISKSCGVPGFRLGILASGNSDLIAKMKKEVANWNINSFGEFYMQIYEKYHKSYVKACESFREERELFLKDLRAVPYLETYDSQANYFLCKVTSRFSSHELAIQLLKNNILIKDYSSEKAFKGGNFIRLAIRTRDDNHYLTELLKSL